MDVGVVLENKLRNEWTATELVPLLTPECMEYVTKEFATLEIGIRARILMAFLSLPVSKLAVLWDSIQKVFDVASADPEEWIRIVLDLVKRRLPPKQDVFPEGDKEKDTQGKADDSYLVYSVNEIAEQLRKRQKSQQTQGKQVISTEFVPLEWPYLCQGVLPQDIVIEDTNKHFKPVDKTSAPSPANAQRPAAPANTAPNGLQHVPDSIKGILNDPNNNKLTPESRASVVQFYSDSPSKPTTGVKLVLLHETREYVDNNTAILLTQTELKLNYADSTAKRVKNKKKYKLKTG